MKKLLLLLILISVSISSFGQKNSGKGTPELPIVGELICYTDVVTVTDSADKNELFSRAREWFANTYKSSTSVMQMEDRESGKLIGKALMQVYHKSMGANHPSGYINYTITIYCRDGRYKYEISGFHHTGQLVGNGNRIPDYGPCEDMINTTDKTMGISYQKTYDYYLQQMNNQIETLISSLKSAMDKPSGGGTEDDW